MIDIFGDIQKGRSFQTSLEKKNFLFSLVLSYTKTCEIPGITIAGSNPDLLQYTPPADAEFLHYGYCKSIDTIPMTPDGKPTPALLTKVALESASIPHCIINAGSKSPQLPYMATGLPPGRNIATDTALDEVDFLKGVDYGRILGRMLSSVTDCLVIGESIPGGTTTAMAVMRGLGIDAKVSSSIPKNPIELKQNIIDKILPKIKCDDPFSIAAALGDPMIPVISGMLDSASQTTKVLLAGGTQMAAVLAFSKSLGYDTKNLAVGTTSYIINDKSANFLEILPNDIPIFGIDPLLDRSNIAGLNAFADGFVKEGVGAGGSIISSMIKTGTTQEKLLQLTEEAYRKIT